MPKKTPNFKVGDKVAYSVQFLKSIGESHGDMALGRGVVSNVRKFGRANLVTIDWQNVDLPVNVLDANLALVGPNTRFCEC